MCQIQPMQKVPLPDHKYVYFLTNVVCINLETGNVVKSIVEVTFPTMARHKGVIEKSVHIHYILYTKVVQYVQYTILILVGKQYFVLSLLITKVHD